jgi:hypothetical protein
VFGGSLSGYITKDELPGGLSRGLQAASLAAVSGWCGKFTLPSRFISFCCVSSANLCNYRLLRYARPPLRARWPGCGFVQFVHRHAAAVMPADHKQQARRKPSTGSGGGLTPIVSGKWQSTKCKGTAIGNSCGASLLGSLAKQACASAGPDRRTTPGLAHPRALLPSVRAAFRRSRMDVLAEWRRGRLAWALLGVRVGGCVVGC